jgi:translation initiation factor 1
MADWKKRDGIVYSTNNEFKYNTTENEEQESIPPSQQNLYVSLDRKQRKGKVVTLVKGYKGKEADLNDLGKKLKSACGSGGSVKEGEIIIQGDFAQRVMDMLIKEGFKVKRSGG